ncbi:DUF6439 family protein [Prochlorococcus marinus]|uniref:DUF6439 family protein n=1 Tax=Prochlorococcus marinus TaxID=1219 RepID=UPI0022B3567D|nr:DUF6439 family protein [Prochlorococcus marinus]
MKSQTNLWPEDTKKTMQELHFQLALDNTNWHKYKTNKHRRTAELLASALSQVINNGKEDDIESLIEQSLRWIREEIKDPGCPSH